MNYRGQGGEKNLQFFCEKGKRNTLSTGEWRKDGNQTHRRALMDVIPKKRKKVYIIKLEEEGGNHEIAHQKSKKVTWTRPYTQREESRGHSS